MVLLGSDVNTSTVCNLICHNVTTNRRVDNASNAPTNICPLIPSLARLKVMEALGVGIGLKTVCIVGGIDMFQQVTD